MIKRSEKTQRKVLDFFGSQDSQFVVPKARKLGSREGEAVFLAPKARKSGSQKRGKGGREETRKNEGSAPMRSSGAASQGQGCCESRSHVSSRNPWALGVTFL